MAVNTPREIVDSYIGLLIMQYLSKPKARGTINNVVGPSIVPQTSVQDIAFSVAPASGTFVLQYNEEDVPAINWNDSASDVQTKLRSLTSLANVTVSGSIASALLTVTFAGVTPPAYSLVLKTNSLSPASVIEIVETDETLPLAVQNAFNLIAGTRIAQGVQLDILGKYVGVVRTGFGFGGSAPITLDDSEFYRLIQMAIVRNQSGSSLATIQDFLNRFFPGEIYLFDHADMTMTYVISSGAVSEDLVAMFVTQGLLPSPMAVRTDAIIYVPTANLFSFRTYDGPNPIGSPFNFYDAYSMTSPWLSYKNIL